MPRRRCPLRGPHSEPRPPAPGIRAPRPRLCPPPCALRPSQLHSERAQKLIHKIPPRRAEHAQRLHDWIRASTALSMRINHRPATHSSHPRASPEGLPHQTEQARRPSTQLTHTEHAQRLPDGTRVSLADCLLHLQHPRTSRMVTGVQGRNVMGSRADLPRPVLPYQRDKSILSEDVSSYTRPVASKYSRQVHVLEIDSHPNSFLKDDC